MTECPRLRVLAEGISEEVKLGKTKGAIRLDILGKNILGGWNSECISPEMGTRLACLGRSEEAGRAKQ